MLTRLARTINKKPLMNIGKRVFSTTDMGFADISDVRKVNYTEEFDQGLTDEQKA